MKLPFVPEEEYEIRTRLSPEEVLSILRENTGAEGAPTSRKPFTGRVGEGAFCIDEFSPHIRVFFKPTLWGRVCEDERGAIVKVKFELGPMAVILYVLLLIAGAVGIFTNFALVLLLPLYLVLMNVGFAIGVETSRTRLLRLIEK